MKRMSALATLGIIVGVIVISCGANALMFEEVPVPVTVEERKSILASPAATIGGKEYAIDYHTVLRSGDTFPGGTFGMAVDIDGERLLDASGEPIISNSMDHTSILQGEDGLYMVTHFEDRPGSLYLTRIKQDSATGALTAVDTRSMNEELVELGGIWTPCAGMPTPWNTHLGSEEYEPDAREVKADNSISGYDDQMARYFNGDISEVNWYHYGWTPEVNVKNFSTAAVVKHYAMGRFAKELSYVLPDGKTVYQGDDGTNNTLFLFVADESGDLSSGMLYAARWVQLNDNHGGKAKIEWISLGHASNAGIEPYLFGADPVVFGDMFMTAEPREGVCPDGFTSINANGRGQECLMLKKGAMRSPKFVSDDDLFTVASRLESRRLAAMLGATSEFRKKEGITYDAATDTLYVAVSEIGKGMLDDPTGKNDIGGANHIRLPENECGAVYALRLGKKVDDVDGTMIPSRHVAEMIDAEVLGKPTTYTDPALADNTCDVNGIANPDNVAFIEGMSTLLIGEDTGMHLNDVIWAYNVRTREMTRIQTTPYGSETTSPYAYRNVGGYGYIMSVVQHPYGESKSQFADITYTEDEMRGYVGYIGPFPAFDGK